MGTDDKSRKDEAAASSIVRSRVLEHLKRLLIPGVMGLNACKGTDQPPVVCDPMPAPVDAQPPSIKQPVQPPPVVCDPMPAPMPPPALDRPLTPKKK